uniref:Transmembrane protein n=1 Tax=Octopus bimaculoides TaxID=37653 RepID=A0A0L8IBB5_OCTBM
MERNVREIIYFLILIQKLLAKSLLLKFFNQNLYLFNFNVYGYTFQVSSLSSTVLKYMQEITLFNIFFKYNQFSVVTLIMYLFNIFIQM